MTKGLAGLKIHLELEDRYFDGIAQIAQDWHVRPSPDFKSNPGTAPFFVDLRIRGAELPSEKEEQCRVDMGRNADGSIQVCLSCQVISSKGVAAMPRCGAGQGERKEDRADCSITC